MIPRRIAVLIALAVAAGCATKPKAKPPRYAELPKKQVPEFLKNTVFELTDLQNIDPLRVNGFGLLVNLDSTGDNTLVPNTVRSFMIKEMNRGGFGQVNVEGIAAKFQPEDTLRDPRTAIVRIDAFIPPGARPDDRVDVQVSALEGTKTTSLARGNLYQCDLKRNGANTLQPGIGINTSAVARGPVFVNPAQLTAGKDSASARASLRYGLILNGGKVQEVRPFILRIRQPSGRLAKGIEALLDQRFASFKGYQDDHVAAAKDEGQIWVQIPARFQTGPGAWEHFAGVMTHTYLDSTPEFAVAQAQKLAIEAVKPDAKLQDISFCMEALGPVALPWITPLMTSDQKPEVQFAAARAAAYLNDPGATQALVDMALVEGHPFQINAVQILATLPSSPSLNVAVRPLLDANNATVRIEAYKLLAASPNSGVFSTMIGGKDGFILDIVPSKGEPLIYASCSGEPRIAIIGNKPALLLPTLFTALDSKLSISSEADKKFVTIFYRGNDIPLPARVQSNPDIAELVARLGGEGAAGQAGLRFNYGEIVAMVQSMADQRKIVGIHDGKPIETAFVLEQTTSVGDEVNNAPVIGEPSRPTGEKPKSIEDNRRTSNE